MFDAENAKKVLMRDRREYLKRFCKMIQGYVDHGYDDIAVESIVTASNCLARLEGSIQYLDSINAFEGYPRFMEWEKCSE